MVDVMDDALLLEAAAKALAFVEDVFLKESVQVVDSGCMDGVSSDAACGRVSLAMVSAAKDVQLSDRSDVSTIAIIMILFMVKTSFTIRER